MSDTSILVSPGDRLTIVLPEHVITCQVLHTRPRACACGPEDAGLSQSTAAAQPPGPVIGMEPVSVPTPTIVVKPLIEVDRNGGQSPIIRQS